MSNHKMSNFPLLHSPAESLALSLNGVGEPLNFSALANYVADFAPAACKIDGSCSP